MLSMLNACQSFDYDCIYYDGLHLFITHAVDICCII